MKKTWLTPRTCADLLEHETTTCVLGAIQSGELPALERTYPSGRKRYRVRPEDFHRWLRETWRPIQARKAG